MGLFNKRKKSPAMTYDPEAQQPAVRRSICTGEITAGFIDKKTGRFQYVMLVDGQAGLEDFCRSIGADADEVKTIY